MRGPARNMYEFAILLYEALLEQISPVFRLTQYKNVRTSHFDKGSHALPLVFLNRQNREVMKTAKKSRSPVRIRCSPSNLPGPYWEKSVFGYR